jgi:hypothetical protein
VVDFFKDRIGVQYPLEKVTTDPFAAAYEAHESFMRSRSENLVGRQNIMDEVRSCHFLSYSYGVAFLCQMLEYITSEANHVPFLLVGNPGSGKSSIMAKLVELAVTQATLKSLPGFVMLLTRFPIILWIYRAGKKGWKVFYHFVGAIPGSTELFRMLTRLLKETELVFMLLITKNIPVSCYPFLHRFPSYLEI